VNYVEERNEIVKVAKMMFERKVSNTTGGNISLKVSDDLYLMTPSMMSLYSFFDILPEELLLINIDGRVIQGSGKPSREVYVHLAIYKTWNKCTSVVHAHPPNCMAFASFNKNIPNVTEFTKKLGCIEVINFAPAGSDELLVNVNEYLKEKVNVFPMAVLLSQHGIIAADISLARAYDLVERVERDAYILLNKPAIMIENS